MEQPEWNALGHPQDSMCTADDSIDRVFDEEETIAFLPWQRFLQGVVSDMKVEACCSFDWIDGRSHALVWRGRYASLTCDPAAELTTE